MFTKLGISMSAETFNIIQTVVLIFTLGLSLIIGVRSLRAARVESEILDKTLQTMIMSHAFHNSTQLNMMRDDAHRDWVGLSIVHYAQIYTLVDLSSLPSAFVDPLKAEIREFFRGQDARNRFEDLKHNFDGGFIDFVNSARMA